MKALILSIFIFAGLPVIFAQRSDNQKWENAFFEVKQNNKTLFVTDIHAENHIFNKTQLRHLKEEMIQKDAIIEIEMIDQKTIRIYHLDNVTIEDLKRFITKYDKQVYFGESESITLDTIQKLIREEK